MPHDAPKRFCDNSPGATTDRERNRTDGDHDHTRYDGALSPPGRYVLQGQPNPSSGEQRTEPLTMDLQGRKTTEITLPAQ